MLEQVVCKLQCHHNAPVTGSDQEISAIRLGAVYAGYEADKLTENAIFGKWTPMAEFNTSITNPAAVAFFKPGKKYYCTFTEAPD